MDEDDDLCMVIVNNNTAATPMIRFTIMLIMNQRIYEKNHERFILEVWFGRWVFDRSVAKTIKMKKSEF